MKRKFLFALCLISVSALRAQVTVTPANATQCAGQVQQLTASGGGAGSGTLFSENFEGGSLGNFTATVVSGTTNASQWTNRTSPYGVGGVWNVSINSGSKFALSNSDLNVGAVNFAIESGVLNTTGYTSLSLAFRHYYSDYSTSATGDFAYIEVSTNGGTSWTTIQTYSTDQASPNNFDSVTIPLGDYLNQANFKFRFRYQAAWNDGWAIDDVVVSGMSGSVASFTWSPTEGLYTNAAATVPYTGAAASTVYAKPTATSTYTASYTSGSDTFTGSATITVTNPAAPTANAAQQFCSAGTVANLQAQGTVVWYSAATGGTALAGTTALVNGTTYYAAQTAGGCEGTARTPVVVTISNTAAPTVAQAAQTFCGAATVADLDAEGQGLKWYAANTGGTALAETTALVNGNSYYASQTVDGCEGTGRTAVAVTINAAAAPVVTQATQTFCNAATIADLDAEGQGLKWYAVSIGGTVLGETTALVNGNSYYASQTINGCEGTARAAVSVMVHVTAAPTVIETTQMFCNAATVADLDAEGEGLKWYAANTGGTALAENTALVSGNSYYASQTVDGCEGTARTAVSVMLHVTNAPTVANATQNFCNAATISDLSANGMDVKWYAATTGGTELADDAVLVNGSVYYASQTIDGCESAGRAGVTAQINVVSEPGGDTTQEITVNNAEDATLADIVVTASGTVTWYATEENALSGENPLPLTTQVVSGNTYYAVQTMGNCASTTPLGVTVDVVLGNKGFDINTFTYSPNPVKDILTVTSKSGITLITIFNMLGQQVTSNQPNTAEAKIDMSGLAAGTYIMNVTSGDSTKTMKIVKE